MKTIRKISIAICALTLAAAMCACGQGGSGPVSPTDASSGETPVSETTIEETIPEKNGIAEDSLPGISFAAPEDYKTAGRTFDEGSGEKDIYFTFGDDARLVFAEMKMTDGEDYVALIKERFSEGEIEERTIAGKPFIVFSFGTDPYAVYQEGDTVYSIAFEYGESEGLDGSAIFEAALDSISFDGGDSAPDNGDELGSIKWSFNDEWNLVSRFSSLEEDADGNTVEKQILWKFGESEDNLSFRFRVAYRPGATLEDVLDENTEYSEVEINGLTYMAVANEGEEPLEYLIQRDDGVYMIKNRGENNSGWLISYSDECKAAFVEFVNGISFE